MRIINHFEETVIYHIERIVLAPAFVGLSLFNSASCSLSFTKANDNLQRAEWFYHAGANPHFERMVIIISKGQSFVISKREFWGYSIVNRGQYLASSEILKGSSSPTYRAYPPAFKRANLRWSIVYLRRYAVCWYFNQSGPKRQPYGGDFHSAVQRLNPGNNSLRDIPIKETVALRLSNFI